MWQKCPICNGTGTEPSVQGSLLSSYRCSVCQGMKIISEVSGLPPASVPPAAHTGTFPVSVTNVPTATFGYAKTTNTDFRDAPMESQDEYFGRK